MRVQLTNAPPVTPASAIMLKQGRSHEATPTEGLRGDDGARGIARRPSNSKGVKVKDTSQHPFGIAPQGPYSDYFINPPHG